MKNIKDNDNAKIKAYIFFGFYLIFFIVLILFIRINNSKRIKKVESADDSLMFKVEKVLDDNYSYSYKVILDNIVHEYVGIKNGKYESFEYDEKKYYKNKDNYFVNDGLWIKSDNPYLYSEFFDSNNIVDLIENAFYESKTEYEGGRIVYNFLISTNTINKNLKDIDSDFEEIPNRLVVSTNNKNELNEVQLYLDSYCKLNNLCNESLKIDISYSNFSKVDSIDNPVE